MIETKKELDKIIEIIESGNIKLAQRLLLSDTKLFLSLECNDFCKLLGVSALLLKKREGNHSYISRNKMWRINTYDNYDDNYDRCNMELIMSRGNPSRRSAPIWQSVYEGKIEMSSYNRNYANNELHYWSTRIDMVKMCL